MTLSASARKAAEKLHELIGVYNLGRPIMLPAVERSAEVIQSAISESEAEQARNRAMTTEQIHTVCSALENAARLLNIAAQAMDPKDDTPPVPQIPEKYAGEFAHEEKPRYSEPREGEWFLCQNSKGKPIDEVLQGGAWTWSFGKRWILRRLPARPPMPAPANECWWSESEKRWITVEDVYRKPLAELSPPDGWGFAEFLPPRYHERFFHYCNGEARLVICVWNHLHPRLILRPAPKRKRLVVEPCAPGEVGHMVSLGGSVSSVYRIVEEL